MQAEEETASRGVRARQRPPEECAWGWTAGPPAAGPACEPRGASRTRAPPLSCPPPCLRRRLLARGTLPQAASQAEALLLLPSVLFASFDIGAELNPGTPSKKDLFGFCCYFLFVSNMAASSRAQVLDLYRAMLRESKHFSAYNYR